jgi:hypothetical protein
MAFCAFSSTVADFRHPIDPLTSRIVDLNLTLPQLRVLRGDKFELLNAQSFLQLARACPGLERLPPGSIEFDDAGLLSLSLYCPKLNNLSGLSDVSDAGLRQAISNLSELQEIELHKCDRISDDGISILVASGLSKLQTLRIIACHSITDVGISALASCEQLVCLWLYSMPHIQSPSIATMLQGCSKLKDIHIDGENTDDEVLVAIGSFCPLLTSFEVKNFAKATDRGLSHLASGCRLLKHFQLQSRLVTDEGVFSLRVCTRLKTFALYNSKITASGVRQLLEHCRRLTSVNLSMESKSVAKRAEKELKRRYPRIYFTIYSI